MKANISRRTFLQAVGISALSVGLAACGGSSGTVSQPNHNVVSNSPDLTYSDSLANKARILCKAVLSGKFSFQNALFAYAGIDTTCEYPVEIDDGVAITDYNSLMSKEPIREALAEGYNFTAFGYYTDTYTDSNGKSYPYTVVVLSYK